MSERRSKKSLQVDDNAAARGGCGRGGLLLVRPPWRAEPNSVDDGASSDDFAMGCILRPLGDAHCALGAARVRASRSGVLGCDEARRRGGGSP